MLNRVVVLVSALMLFARQGGAQQCAAGDADTIPNAGDGLDGMALHWTPQQVREGLRDVLRKFKYEILPTSSDSGYETKPNYRFPDHPAVQNFRRYEHPGITVRARVQAEADSARLFVFARALCRVPEPPPSGFSTPVESSLELIAAQEIAFGVVEELRRRHPRRL